MDVKYITYKGDKLPVRVGYYALKKFKEDNEGISFDEMQEKITKEKKLMDVEQYEILLWHSLVAGHHAADKEMVIKREDIEFIVDQTIEEFISVMGDQMPKDDEEVVGNVPNRATRRKKSPKQT